MLYHEREHENNENANFVHIAYPLAKLCNIFNEAFLIDVSIYDFTGVRYDLKVNYNTRQKKLSQPCPFFYIHTCTYTTLIGVPSAFNFHSII